MASLFRLIILAPVAVVVVLLSIANRMPVQLSFDPSGGTAYTVTVPLFVAVLGAVMAGILIGGVACWFGQGKHRRAARQAQREAEVARSEVARLTAMLPQADPHASALPPTMIR